MCSFFLSSLCQLEQLAHLQQSPVPLQFPLPDVVIATDAMPTYWTFYFQGSGLPLSVSGSWLCSLCRAHIALLELQAIAIMLCRIAFCLSGKVVPLHLDNSTAKVYLCKDWLLLEWHLLPWVAYATFCPGGLPEVDLLASSYSIQCQHYFTLETPLPLGTLGLNALSHPWTFQVSYVFPPHALFLLVLSKFLAEHVSSQLRHLILVVPCWMEAPWLPTVLNIWQTFCGGVPS